MNFIKNNQEIIVVVLIVAGIFGIAAGVGTALRGGQPWAYAQGLH